MKTSVYIAASLDGFIARADGDIGWLPTDASGGEDYGYNEFIASVDYLVMGRNSYEKVLTFGAWPYGDTRVVVLSHRSVPISEEIAATVESMCASPAEVVERLAMRGARHLYVDGGKTIQGFLEADLVDRLIITRIPILLGAGIPLFGPMSHDVRLRHLETKSYATGLVQSSYEVVREAARS